MERDRWEQIERLYHAALERGPDACDAFFNDACTGDEYLRREYELAAKRRAKGIES